MSMSDIKFKDEVEVKPPFVLKNMLDKDTLRSLQRYALSLWIKSEPENYSEGFGRYQFNDTPILKDVHNSLTEIARKEFGSSTLQPSWVLLSIYEGEKAKLWKHKDDNACTYHIDLCLFQKTPWALWVEGEPYTLLENEGLFMYGNEQEHWREAFPDPENNLVANIFFFFCEPDHWFFTQGPRFLEEVIRPANAAKLAAEASNTATPPQMM